MSHVTRDTSVLALALCWMLQAALAAEPDFATAEQAFEITFLASGIGRRGYEENREYAAAFYQMPDGRWHATAVVPGNRMTSAIPYHLVPAGATRVVGAHTHGQPRVPEDPARVYGTDFSQTDRRNAMIVYQSSHGLIDSQLLLTSRLQVLRLSIGLNYDARAGRIALTAETTELGTWADQLAEDP